MMLKLRPTRPIYAAGVYLICWVVAGASLYLVKEKEALAAAQSMWPLALVPFLVRQHKARSWRSIWLLPFLVFAGLNLLAFQVPGGTNTVYFLWAFALLWLADSLLFAVPSWVGLLMVLASNASSHIMNLVSFSWRLKISEQVAWMLRFLDAQAKSQGNIIFFEGKEYLVDVACLGVKMLSQALMVTALFMGLVHFAQRRNLPVLWLILSLGGTIYFALAGNLARVAALVYFDLPETHWLHYAVGLACFAAFTLAPTLAIVALLYKLKGVNLPAENETPQALNLKLISLTIPFACVVIALAVGLNKRPLATVATKPNMQGYVVSKTVDNIMVGHAEGAVVYIKPLNTVMGDEHNPLFCWVGSGYTILNYQHVQRGNQDWSQAQFRKDGKEFYSAWWYTDGKLVTVNPIRWRWQMLWGGGSFSIVNVTASTPEELARRLGYFQGDV